jgi:hypothetical protein
LLSSRPQPQAEQHASSTEDAPIAPCINNAID